MNSGESLRPNIRFQSVPPKPFLKWAGGKRSVIPALAKHLPKGFNTYCEPFVGGGALFFNLRPRLAFLSDTNAELVNTYRTIRDYPEELVLALSKHIYDQEHFYQVRAQDPMLLSQIEQAARMIYLNRVGYNGLYRVNKKGEFNVPFGRYKNPRIVDVENIFACSEALRGVFIENFSFEVFPWQTLEQGDFVYFDPPYIPISKTSDFTSYTKQGFGHEGQKRLAQLCRELTEHKIQILLTNSFTEETLNLYEGFNIHEISVARPINSKANLRGGVKEAVITNY